MRRAPDDRADPVDRTRFPVEEWGWRETCHGADDLGATETVFAVANGYLGLRGNGEEGRDVDTHGTFINGFHETWRIRHAEDAFGFAQTGQTIVNVPDVKTIKLYVDDEPLMLSMADLDLYDRRLDFREGVLRRSLVWRMPTGKRVRIESQRMVSFEHRHLVVMTFEVTLLDADAPVAISSQVQNRQDSSEQYQAVPSAGRSVAKEAAIDPRKPSILGDRVLLPRTQWSSERRMVLSYECANSGMTLAVAVDHEITTESDYETLSHVEADLGKKIYRVKGQVGRPIRIVKTAAFHTSRGAPVRELVDRTRRTLDRVRDSGVGECFAGQRRWLDRFWADADVRVEGHPATQQAVRWNLYQLAQATGRVEQSGIAAKGVTGSGYEGHYFWDSETYVLPFLSYTSPQVARGVLRFRYLMLPAARRRAADLSQLGALFPWRTINGEEASAYYAAGTAQYHINADVAFALCKYVQATGDDDFMLREGIDLLVLTARLWADLGFWLDHSSPTARSFHLHGVTGPDEYTTVVNNNLFTNVMASDNLRQASRWARRLASEFPDGYRRLCQRLDLADEEIDEWASCAEHMFIPFDEDRAIHPQDQHFLERERWDLTATPDDKWPLLLHYHPLVIYRFQVLKQADVVAALFLQGQMFTQQQKRADFEYYDPITTGDSTLSAVVQSIVAAEVGHRQLALNYFHAGLYVDLVDLHGNTSDGVHVASAGGVWNCLVYGFAGLRDHNGTLSFDPRLPVSWPRLEFTLRVRGRRLGVALTADRLVFTLRRDDAATTKGEPLPSGAAPLPSGAEPLHVSVRGERVLLTVEKPTTVMLDGQGPVIETAVPSVSAAGDDQEHQMHHGADAPAFEEPTGPRGLAAS